MSFNFHDQGFIPGESYSRCLDRAVAADEYPYGYENGDPPAGHHNTKMVTKYKNEKERKEKPL